MGIFDIRPCDYIYLRDIIRIKGEDGRFVVMARDKYFMKVYEINEKDKIINDAKIIYSEDATKIGELR